MKKNKLNIFIKIKNRISNFLSRRPHRSFRLSKRRDYNRSMKVPGLFKFTKDVTMILWNNKKTFLILALVYAVFMVAMAGIISQADYNTLTDTLDSTSNSFFTGAFGSIGKASMMYLTAVTGGLSGNLTDVQKIYSFIILLFAWLTSVWLLRNILAGHKVKVRDGLYNAGSPILSTVMVSLLLIVQMLPFAIALIGYSAATVTGLLDGGVEAMLFWIAAGILTVLSLYWITSTIFALIIITLPGMYPYRAIKTAGDLVVGRRSRILLRFLWMVFVTLLAWALVLMPIIILDSWIKSIWPASSWVPVVPIVIMALSSLSVIWVSSYVYLLYRKIIDDDNSQT